MSLIGQPAEGDASAQASGEPSIVEKLWLYTNFDCNLWCTYCVAESSPRAARRDLAVDDVRRLVDEAADLGFNKVFFTGGEPFVLDSIYDMLAYACERINTTVLTNAMLLRGKRLERLSSIANENLSVQVSLDGATAEAHDAYRGKGSWAKTVDGIRRLQANGFHVCISTTETPANSAAIDEAFVRALGIAEENHFVRPLARRGFSHDGIDVGTHNLLPEVTVTADGVYWHPLMSPSDTDMLVTRQIYPLAQAVECIRQRLATGASNNGDERAEFQ
jgi:sulfatase maturation enzyme AslB (radical SAM superfamily)